MAESFERIICKDKGKYFEIGFTSGLISLVLYLPLMYLGRKYFSVDEKEIMLSPLLFHMSITIVYGFLIGLKNNLNSKQFFLRTIIIGVLVEILYPTNISIYIYGIILAITWFFYSTIFLVLEKKIALDTNDTFEENQKKEKEEKEKENSKEDS